MLVFDLQYPHLHLDNIQHDSLQMNMSRISSVLFERCFFEIKLSSFDCFV